ADVPPGAYDVRVLAKATINGKEVSKLVTVSDVVKAGLNGLPFPPREMLTSVGVAVTGPPLFDVAVKLPKDVTRGVAANVTVTAKRADGFADEIQLAAVNLPANVTLAAKPIPKGATEVTFPLTVAAAVNPGPLTLTLRAAAKPGGKDFAYYSAPATTTVVAAPDKKAEPKVEPKKAEAKKAEPKKAEPKKEAPFGVRAEPTTLTLKVGQKAKLKVIVTRKGDFKGPVDVEVKNLPANVTAAKATVAADKAEVEIELAAAFAAAAGDKPDVQVLATGAGQAVAPPPVVLKVVK
ncbi:MAG TPA: hypothetical protein VM597_21095, partial [Gemmataceae bacterium]|nr:hypothetical protein [Gemmataceae bacterium]